MVVFLLVFILCFMFIYLSIYLFVYVAIYSWFNLVLVNLFSFFLAVIGFAPIKPFLDRFYCRFYFIIQFNGRHCWCVGRLYVVLCAIWYHSNNLKNVKNTHGTVLLIVKLQALACNFTKNDTPPWVFFTFFKLNMILNRATHHIFVCCSFMPQATTLLLFIFNVTGLSGISPWFIYSMIWLT